MPIFLADFTKQNNMTENEMTGLLLQLADRGVTGIKVKYDGGGDSGAIEWIGYTTEKCDTPEDIDDHINDWENDSNLAQLDSDAYSLIENFASEKILDELEDWWNNEGGFGDLCICIPSGKYFVNNHVRVTETEDYFHEGNLISKSLN
jgi:hypothetical protein